MRKKHKKLFICAIAITAAFLLNPIIFGYGDGEGQKVELFDGIGSLLVRGGSEFVDVAEDVAMMFPVDENENWAVWINYYDVGYIEEIFDMDRKRILDFYQDINITDIEFYYDLSYDFDKSKWSWGVMVIDSENEQYLDYREIIFTREGFLHIQLYCPPEDAASFIAYISDAVTISSGHTYYDFDPSFDAVNEVEVNGDSISDQAFAKRAGLFPILLVTALIIIRSMGRRSRKDRKRTSGKNPQADRKWEKKHKSIHEKRQFKIRRTHDEEVYIDSRTYYLMLREEEERLARKYN